MADPEIELPMTSSQLALDDQPSGIRTRPTNPDDVFRNASEDPTFAAFPTSDEKYNEKSDNEALSEDDEQEPGDIVYHYLTFSTELPNPTTIYPTREDQETPPHPPDLVKFTSPFEWPNSRKRVIIWVSCVITALTAFTAGAYSPGVGQMTEEWHISNVAALVGITTFTSGTHILWKEQMYHNADCSIGFAIAPMVLAPFSEINGRRPVFIASGILFVICQLCTGLTRSYAGMLVVRFFVGVGGSTFSTMGTSPKNHRLVHH